MTERFGRIELFYLRECCIGLGRAGLIHGWWVSRVLQRQGWKKDRCFARDLRRWSRSRCNDWTAQCTHMLAGALGAPILLGSLAVHAGPLASDRLTALLALLKTTKLAR